MQLLQCSRPWEDHAGSTHQRGRAWQGLEVGPDLGEGLERGGVCEEVEGGEASGGSEGEAGEGGEAGGGGLQLWAQRHCQ